MFIFSHQITLNDCLMAAISFSTINKLISPSRSHSLEQNWPKTPHSSADKDTAGLKTVFVPNLIPRSIKPWSNTSHRDPPSPGTSLTL